MMNYSFSFVVAVAINMILKSTHCHVAVGHSTSSRNKNGDIFNLLLGLYKLNPLKGSQAYKAFSEDVLSGHSDKKSVVMNFESNESVKRQVKSNLNEIEKVIHVKSKKPRKIFQKPEYDIEDADIENFTVDIVLNEKIARLNEPLEQYKLHRNTNNVDNADVFSSLFGHIGSNEIDNDIPVTKLLPVNDTALKFNDVSLKYINNRNRYIDNIGSLVEIRNDMQDRIVMSEKLDTADVIVL